MTTAVIYEYSGEVVLYIFQGNYKHLDGTYIGEEEDTDKEEELLKLIEDEEGIKPDDKERLLSCNHLIIVGEF